MPIKQFAESLGVDPSLLHRWMRGTPPGNWLTAIDDALDRLSRQRTAKSPGAPLLDEDERAYAAVQREASGYLARADKFVPLTHALAWIQVLHHSYERLRRREAEHRLLEDNVADVVWTTDLAQRFQYHSPSVWRLRGLTPEEANRRSLEDTLTPGSIAKVRHKFAEVLELGLDHPDNRGRVFVEELETYHANGSIVPVEVCVGFVRDAEQRATGFIGVSRALSTRKAIDAARDALFKRARVPMAFVDSTGRFVMANDAVRRLLQRDVRGLHFNEVTAEPDRDQSHDLFSRCMAGTTPDPGYSIEKRYVRADGSAVKCWVHTHKVELTNPEGPSMLCVMLPSEADAALRRFLDGESGSP